ncbi:MAG: hypothetical protein ABSA83_11680 [Verrucomicrobiota bacterium]
MKSCVSERIVSSKTSASVLVELVEKRFRVGDFGELEALPFQILAIVLLNFCAGAADHQKLEDFLPGLPRIFLHGAEIGLAVALAVKTFEPPPAL